MGDNVKKTIFIDSIQEASILYGNHDKHLRFIKDKLHIGLIARNGMIKITGDKVRVKMVTSIFDSLINKVKSTGRLNEKDVEEAIKTNCMIIVPKNENDIDLNNHNLDKNTNSEINNLWNNIDTNNKKINCSHLDNTQIKPQEREIDTKSSNAEKEQTPKELKIDVFFKNAIINPKTSGQEQYVEAIKKNEVVFCIGPAGTGKTYLAVALALSALKNEIVDKIVLARPAVEAGEKLGYLPGDIHAKVNPYLRPLYDALTSMMDTAQVKKYLDNDLIEILPLAFMRGRTLNNSFIILDEAQNCTSRQMKTFLTRLGFKSRIVVTGDVTQIDLPNREISGLIDVQNKLLNIPGIAFSHLTKSDIVRHKLVKDIIDAYERFK